MPANLIDMIVYTRDRHPTDHCSFGEYGGTWAPHCVQGTQGSELSPELTVVPNAVFIDKGLKVDRDAYSGFDGTDLASRLRSHRIGRCLIAGLATDYCVKATAIDAVNAGFETWVLTDAIAAVNRKPGDEERALLDMRAAGVRLTDTGQISTILLSHAKPTALIVVDVQNDFCPGGALAVATAPRIFTPLNQFLQHAGRV